MPRDVIDPAPTPEEIVVRDEVVASVAGAVGLLPSGQRDAVRLFYLDELSYREVAATLGTTSMPSKRGCIGHGAPCNRSWPPCLPIHRASDRSR